MVRLRLALALLIIGSACSNEGVTPGGGSVSADSVAAPTTTSPTSTTTTTTPTSTTSTTTSTTTTLPPLDLSLAGERMLTDLAVLVGLGVREAGSEAERAAFAHIQDRLIGAGLEVHTESVPLPNGKTSQNTWTTIGTGSAHVLLGAHVDSKPPSPGADDNGSGTVVLLEMARRLAERPIEGTEVTIAFFGAEEVLIGYGRNDHHYGSRQMAGRLEEEGNLPGLMVSADMIGVGASLVGAVFRDTDTTAAMLLADAAELHGLDLAVVSRGDISDHEAFARKGVPSVFMWRPDNPDYHLATDLTVRSDALIEDLAVLEGFLDLASG